MNAKQAILARKQLERRLEPLRGLELTAPPKGWIKALREALGMTTRQLAARMSVASSRIPTMEMAEVSGATSLRTLRQAAAALNCRLVYVFVPIEPLEDILRKRALEKAREEILRLDHTMRLENQALMHADLEAVRQRALDQIRESLRGLWDDDA